MTPVARYFDTHARAFDRVYEERGFATRVLRPGPARGRDLAVSVVARHPFATVLDIGCGPGRVAEAVLAACGATTYVGIDLSPRMLALARDRVSRFDSVELLEGDFLRADIRRTFDVVLALGVFDYLDQPVRAAEWMRAHCSSALVASFTRWEPIKAPVRHLHYALHRCRLVDYTEPRVEALLSSAGFETVEFASRGRWGFMVCATGDGR